MSERRRMLLAIVNQFKFLPYSYTYLYHSLVPQTISGKNVRNKAKFTKIYGNSEVVNQLCPALYDYTHSGGVVFTTSNNGRKATLSGTSSGYWTYTLSFGKTLPIGSVVLVSVKLTNPNNLMFGYRLREEGIIPMEYDGNTQLQIRIITSAINCIQFYGNPNLDYTGCEIEDVQVVVLNQQYPFDTPTTLTDNRVKNILAQGYIPPNTGEIKDMEIGNFSSEPYNLFDGELEGNGLNSDGTIGYNANNFRTKDYTPIVGGLTYIFEYNHDLLGGYMYYCWYDENHICIGGRSTSYGSSSVEATAPNNALYVKLQWYKDGSGWASNTPTQEQAQVCIHLKGTRTGYAPYKAPSTLSLPALYKSSGIGTSKDSWEITNTSHIFTRNNFYYTFTGNESWIQWTYERAYTNVIASSVKIPSGTDYLANALLDNYQIYYQNNLQNVDKSFCIAQNGNINVRDVSNIANIQSLMAGHTIKYQLATPQVITIPRKHLAVVDLGSITYKYDSANQRFYSEYGITNIKSANVRSCPMYCSLYLTKMNGEAFNNSWNMVVYKGSTDEIYIHNHDYSSPTDFKSAMSGVYLFYETENEVADITDTFDIEACGSVNGNLFSWVRNQLVANGNFDSNSGWAVSSGTYSISNNIATFLATSHNAYFYHEVSLNSSNKYLVIAKIKTTTQTNAIQLRISGQTIASSVASTSWQNVVGLVSNISSGYVGLRDNRNDSFDNIEVDYIEVIDLNVAFQNGDIPTDINDYRIQYILEHGYIPTDTNGTYTNETCEVLPDVDFKFKCK